MGISENMRKPTPNHSSMSLFYINWLIMTDLWSEAVNDLRDPQVESSSGLLQEDNRCKNQNVCFLVRFSQNSILFSWQQRKANFEVKTNSFFYVKSLTVVEDSQIDWINAASNFLFQFEKFPQWNIKWEGIRDGVEIHWKQTDMFEGLTHSLCGKLLVPCKNTNTFLLL